MDTFGLRIIASDKVFFNGRCKKLTIPAPDGEKGVLAHHENMVFAVEVGEIRILEENGNTIYGVTGTGFAQIINNRATVIVDTCESPEEIDVRRAQEAKERAEERIALQTSRKEYYRGQMAMARAMTRLKIKEKKFM